MSPKRKATGRERLLQALAICLLNGGRVGNPSKSCNGSCNPGETRVTKKGPHAQNKEILLVHDTNIEFPGWFYQYIIN